MLEHASVILDLHYVKVVVEHLVHSCLPNAVLATFKLVVLLYLERYRFCPLVYRN